MKIRNSNIEIRNKFEISKNKNSKKFDFLKIRICNLFRISDFVLRISFTALLSALCALPAFSAEKTPEQELLEKRQKIELLGFYLKDPRDAAIPATPEAVQLYNIAVEAFQANDFEMARKALNDSLGYDKTNPLAYELLGDIDYLQQKLTDAKANYQIALNLQPSENLKKKIEKTTGEVKVETTLSTYHEQHFIIKYHKEQNKDQGFELREMLRDCYKNISQDFGYYFNHQVVVILYDDEEFKELTGMPHWVAGLYDGKVRMPLHSSGFNETDLKALTSHELTHAFVAAMSNGYAPPWINEGLAEYEEDKIRKNDMIVFESAVKTNTLLPLVQLMSEKAVNTLQDPLLVSLFYEQSFHLVSYMVKRYGMFRVKQVLGEFGKNQNSEEAIRNVLNISSERLEREWKTTF